MLLFGDPVQCTPVTMQLANFRGASEFVALPALQKTFVDFFFEFAWEFRIEKCRGFLVNVFWSPFLHETKHGNSSKNSGKIRSKLWGKIRDEIQKFGELLFCNSSDLTNLGIWGPDLGTG